MSRLLAICAFLSLGSGLCAATLERLPIPPRSETWTHRRGVQTGLVVAIQYSDREVRAFDYDRLVEGIEKNREWLRHQSYFNFDIAWELYPEVIQMETTGDAMKKLTSYNPEFEEAQRLVKAQSGIDMDDYHRVWLIGSLNKCGAGCADLNGRRMAINETGTKNAQHEMMHTIGMGHPQNLIGWDIGSRMVLSTKIGLGWCLQDDPDGFGYYKNPEDGVYRLYDYQNMNIYPEPGQRGIWLVGDRSVTPDTRAWVLSHEKRKGVFIANVNNGGITHPIIDLTPGSNPDNESRDIKDGDLQPGDSYTTDDGLWRITALEGAPNDYSDYIDVQIERLKDLPPKSAPEVFSINGIVPVVIATGVRMFDSGSENPTLSTGVPYYLTLSWTDADNDLQDFQMLINGEVVDSTPIPFPATFTDQRIEVHFPWTFTEPGDAAISIIATDETGRSTTSAVDVFPVQTNQPPNIISFNADPESGATPGDTVNLKITATDDDNSLQRPDGFAIYLGETLLGDSEGGSNFFDVDWGAPSAGTFTFTAVVTDTLGQETTRELTITILADGEPPSITGGPTADPATVDGTTTALSVSATDPDGEDSALTYTWSAPVFPVFDNTPAPTFSPNGSTDAADTVATFAGAGDYVLRVTVQDASGHTVTGDVEVRVDQAASAVQVDPE